MTVVLTLLPYTASHNQAYPPTVCSGPANLSELWPLNFQGASKICVSDKVFITIFYLWVIYQAQYMQYWTSSEEHT